VHAVQPFGHSLKGVLAAGGQFQIAAYFGERFGGSGTDAFGCAGDQGALAAQKKVRGASLIRSVDIRRGARGSAKGLTRPSCAGSSPANAGAAR
jgi:hypothetical protein